MDRTGAIWEKSASMIHPRSRFATVKYKGKPMLLGGIVQYSYTLYTGYTVEGLS